jgi:hypothetical protein
MLIIDIFEIIMLVVGIVISSAIELILGVLLNFCVLLKGN